jgi:hypothetical protein
MNRLSIPISEEVKEESKGDEERDADMASEGSPV